MRNKIILIFLLVNFFFTNLYAEENIYQIFADKIIYKNNNNTIIAEGNAKIYDQKGKQILSDKINYDKKNKIIKTFSNTVFIDNDKNKIITNNLIYDISKKAVYTKSYTKIIDNKENEYEFKKINYNLDLKEGFGENFNGLFKDGSSFKSEKIFFNLAKGISVLTKSNYTSCSQDLNNSEEFCPWWSLKTSKTTHDQNSKTIKHKNAILSIKKIPILYVPYFEHPDPSVKRRSGILVPTIKNVSSVGRALQVPYFWAIDESSDMTITPIYYYKEKPLILNEYRKKNKNSFLILDTSYTQGYSNYNNNDLERSPGSRNHFYLNYKYNFKENYFDKSELNLQIQKVSQENYLKVNQINTTLAKEDDKQLENKIQFIGFNSYSGLDLNLKIFEDLNKHDVNKYEYLFPYGNYSFYTNKFSNSINFISNFTGKKINAENKSTEIVNEINTATKEKVFKEIGTSHILKTKLTNVNIYNKNKINTEDNTNNYFTVALDNSIPLFKKVNNTEYIIKPKIFTKYTTGSMKIAKEDDKNLFYSDIFSMDRSISLTNPETGFSVGVGAEFESKKKDLYNNVYLKNLIGIGQVYRTTKLDQMPSKSSLDNKQSSFAGFYELSFLGNKDNNLLDKKIDFLSNFAQNKFSVKYDFNLNKNLSSLDKNTVAIQTTFLNKLYTTLEFDEKNNYAGDDRKINFNTNFILKKNFYASYETSNDLKKNFKEYEKFGIFYENECIKLGFNLKKEFYVNSEISNNKSLFFNIIIKPFGNDFTPDLSEFIN